MMRAHPELGHALLDGLELNPVDTWILPPHDFDGTGRSASARRSKSQLGSRIILVADAFDAIVSERSYRRAGSVGDALTELRRTSGTQFDPVVVTALERHLGLSGHLGLVAVERGAPPNRSIELVA